MQDKDKENCFFWRWLILSVVRFPKLYALVWGIVVLLGIIFMKTDIGRLIDDVLR